MYWYHIGQIDLTTRIDWYTIPLIILSVIRVTLSLATRQDNDRSDCVHTHSCACAATSEILFAKIVCETIEWEFVESTISIYRLRVLEAKVAKKKKRNELSSAFSNPLTSQERSCEPLETLERTFSWLATTMLCFGSCSHDILYSYTFQ